MKTALTQRTRFAAHLLGTAALASLWFAFAYAHLRAYLAHGDWSYLVFAASETLVAVLFLARSEAQAVSQAPLDWALAIASTAAPFLFVPASEAALSSARFLILAAVLVQIGGLLSLNRSFGLVAARRQVKTGGLYRVVRHPLYASYLLGYLGYMLNNTSAANIATCLLASSLLLLRAWREERFLSQDSDYRIYMQRVKYRVLPLVF